MIKPMLKSLVQCWRTVRLRQQGVALGRNAQIGTGVHCEAGFRDVRGQIVTAPGCSLSHGVILAAWGGRITLGQNVFVGPYVVMYGHGGIEVGDNTLISMHCRILSSNHSIPPPNIPIRSQPDILLPTKIGRDVWLGAGVTVLGGVSIDDGCVVGAGAVVATNLPSNSVAVGVPARVIRQRV
jgi:acetyltransferase-like isoleucine patch superfamily enzyme